MPDFLFATFDGGGHATPALSVARGLIARGHTVRMLADEVLRAEVEAAGVTWVGWDRAPHDVPKTAASLPPLKEFARVRDATVCGPAAAYAADTRAEIERDRPDCVVADLMLPGVCIAGEGAGVPCVTLALTPFSVPGWGQPPAGPGLTPMGGPLGRLRDALLHRLNSRLWNAGLAAVNAARQEQGLEPVRDVWEQIERPDRLLVLSSRALQFPGATPPAHVTIAGARIDDPAWAQPWRPPAGEQPLILVALSSDQMGQAPVLRRIAEGLRKLDVRVVLTTGPNVRPDEVPAPPNVQVVGSAPHAEVLRHAAAVVTHGGHGTVVRTLAADVPMVILHHGRDQADNATRVTTRGAGLAVKRTATPAVIAAAVRRLLDDPAFAAGARQLGESIRRDAASGALVAELEGDVVAEIVSEGALLPSR